ncbi:PP2C family protein-serine/threonine phosphatase [Jatrophihabitans fulvus]
MLTMTSGSATHAGKVRTSNEDSLLVSDHFVAVADGLGGHAAGEVASQIAVDRLRQLDELAHHVDAVRPDDVVSAIADANALIIDEMRRDAEHEGMGTTVTGLGIVELGGAAHVAVFNVGDSRVYRLVDDRFEQVTVDHSEVEELRAAGIISAADAAVHPRRNVVTRCLGSIPAPTPDLWVYPPRARERYLLCSDGLTNEVDDEALAATLRAHDDPDAAAQSLVEQALEHGGRDNVTVIVVDLRSDRADDDAAVDGDTAPRPAPTDQ